jgi:hypothetical protein
MLNIVYNYARCSQAPFSLCYFVVMLSVFTMNDKMLSVMLDYA